MGETAIVIDNGSGMIKAGVAGQEKPSTTFPPVVGHRRYYGIVCGGIGVKDNYVGYEVRSQLPSTLTLKYPIERGIITDWNGMEKIWNHIFSSELHVVPEECSVLLTDTPLNPVPKREKMTEVMFETFNVPGLYIEDQAVLSLYASGCNTGIVLDSGDGVTHSVPIINGRAVPNAALRLDLGGRDLTAHLTRIITEGGHSLANPVESESVRDIKEKMCYVALDYEQEYKVAQADSDNLGRSYELPDGRKITIVNERFRTPEALFQPQLAGVEGPGIHDMISGSISNFDPDVQVELYRNIVLAGGSTMFPGIDNRLTLELSGVAPSEVLVSDLPERQYSAWIGGSMLASLSTFRSTCWKYKEYDEIGPTIIHRSRGRQEK
ncbi:hypothetical protein AX16_003064 [Volvariella volvacea WC 439]|nr:hypothetical protein AX16_003064 [Volvariella volvacea WC 439]